MAMDFASQNIISCITFTTYVVLGNSLTAAKVFSSIAFLNALQRSVTRHFPPAIQKLNEATIAVKRIQVREDASIGIIMLIDYSSCSLLNEENIFHCCFLSVKL